MHVPRMLASFHTGFSTVGSVMIISLSTNGWSHSENQFDDSPHIRESKSVLDSGFLAVDSGFQVLDSGICQ